MQSPVKIVFETLFTNGVILENQAPPQSGDCAAHTYPGLSFISTPCTILLQEFMALSIAVQSRLTLKVKVPLLLVRRQIN